MTLHQPWATVAIIWEDWFDDVNTRRDGRSSNVDRAVVLWDKVGGVLRPAGDRLGVRAGQVRWLDARLRVGHGRRRDLLWVIKNAQEVVPPGRHSDSMVRHSNHQRFGCDRRSFPAVRRRFRFGLYARRGLAVNDGQRPLRRCLGQLLQRMPALVRPALPTCGAAADAGLPLTRTPRGSGPWGHREEPAAGYSPENEPR